LYQFAPARSRQSYRHEAFMWHGPSDFAEGMVAFVADGLASDEPVMVALVPEHNDWIRDGLNDQASQVTFIDMDQLGGNPARIIPAWQQFLDTHSGPGRPARGIGEPIWATRRAEELTECQLHEALLNVAVGPETPFWLICPYDVEHLSSAVIAEAHRSHPAVLDVNSYQGSTAYTGRAHVDELIAAELPPLPDEALEFTFTSSNVQDVFGFILLEAAAYDLWSNKALDLATAVRQLAADSLHRGEMKGVVRAWHRPEALVCEVADATALDDVLAGRRGASGAKDDGLWSANQSCDLVQMRTTPAGTTVRVHAWR